MRLRLRVLAAGRGRGADRLRRDALALRARAALGSNHYCNKVDVWAVGCIMGELSSGAAAHTAGLQLPPTTELSSGAPARPHTPAISPVPACISRTGARLPGERRSTSCTSSRRAWAPSRPQNQLFLQNPDSQAPHPRPTLAPPAPHPRPAHPPAPPRPARLSLRLATHRTQVPRHVSA